MNLKPPGYTQKPKQVHTPWHQVPGYGLCPQCGKFAPVNGTQRTAEYKTQYRACPCGNRFQTVVPQ